MHALCAQAGHDSRLLVVTHTLLKEVRLASASRSEAVSCGSLKSASDLIVCNARILAIAGAKSQQVSVKTSQPAGTAGARSHALQD